MLKTAPLTLIPLFIGFAIDGFMGRDVFSLCLLGTIRVALGAELADRNASLPVLSLSAEVLMARELVDFLEQ
ncbi:ABC transporter six-transmembrane domain-containing protein [Tropicibacter sp. Alg240-R139]|uniref:ABC transporter six-transmembrane domain-containing protein n=1 Tax=Tropicibacter sp. Alg240-R139 TaxID=2305991 RepID=UPI001F080C62|nr:ABC transporter six-transmembrane domain-containing protein [Tropicibacter sp. Alg240-R139]